MYFSTSRFATWKINSIRYIKFRKHTQTCTLIWNYSKRYFVDTQIWVETLWFYLAMFFSAHLRSLIKKKTTIQKGSKLRPSFIWEHHHSFGVDESAWLQRIRCNLAFYRMHFSGSDFWKSHKLSFVVCKT